MLRRLVALSIFFSFVSVWGSPVVGAADVASPVAVASDLQGNEEDQDPSNSSSTEESVEFAKTFDLILESISLKINFEEMSFVSLRDFSYPIIYLSTQERPPKA